MSKITESDSHYDALEQMSTDELLISINKEDSTVSTAVKNVIPKISTLVKIIVEKLKNNGRLFYLGAGTSGRLGILDASECPPTFGVSHGVVVGLIAGGDSAIRKAVEFAEDCTESGWKDLKKSPDEKCFHHIIGVTIDAELFSIDAKDGKLCKDFGNNGRVNLREGLGEHPDLYYWSTSPPAIINEKIVVGGSVIDNLSTDIPGGVVRAYDIRTGELEWYWDPIPPNEATVLDENGNPLYRRGTANVWSIISADPELNMVYLPTGNASPDYYGGHRKGLEEYSSSVVALNADTGKLEWSFQTVHHDIWDYDVPSQPTFYEFEKDGKIIKALAQTTKTGLVFLLNRETGEPIFPVEEREVPQGAVEGDYVSKTQPFPTKPAPLSC